MKKLILLLTVFIIINCNYSESFIKDIKLPPGFEIEIMSKNVKGARSLTLSKSGTIYVSTRIGNIYALKDYNNDNKIDKRYVIADNLNTPNGIDFHNGDLYVAEVTKILKYENIEENFENPKYKVIYSNLPEQYHHEWRYMRIGPDEKIYIGIGAPCNVCLKKNNIFSTICRMNLDGSNFEIFAHGVRNTVGFDWHPETDVLWFTDNGRDWLGDNKPPDELNRAEKKGLHFGFPFLHGKNIKDPKFGDKINNISKFIKPELELGPHVAALGMRFYIGKNFPEEYRNQIFIAEHGSWNRSIPIGYRITMGKKDSRGNLTYETFASGWLRNNKKYGRPVDLEIMKDGSLIVSDDKNGYLYRIYYKD